MSKWYEVKVVQTKVFAVEVEDSEADQDACKLVEEEICGEDFDAITVKEQSPEDVKSLLHHTDYDKVLQIN